MRWVGSLLAALLAGGCLVSVADVESRPDAGSDASSGQGGDGWGGSGAFGGAGGSLDASGDAGQSGQSGAAGSAGSAGASDASSDAALPVFFDDFSVASPNWIEVGQGMWEVQAGELVQSSNTAELSLAYVSLVDQADYRVVARMRQIGNANHVSGALEIAFRIDPTGPTLYHCNWEPNDGRIVIQWLDGSAQDVIEEKFSTLPIGYDSHAPFTLELTVVAGQIQCRVLEVPGSELAVPAVPLFASGHVGLKTWRMAGAIDWFEVYAL